jgi:hypothetical protein
MLQNKRYKTIEELIWPNLCFQEDDKTLQLIKELRIVKNRGYFHKDELFKMGMWKSPRPKHLYLNNSNEDVILLSKNFLSCNQSEKKKTELLTKLHGVAVPTASAIQFLIDPKNYCVIDVRVWQVLHLYKVVENKPSGTNLSVANWADYLLKIRHFAIIFGVSSRVIERTLFFYHKTNQVGSLYQ